MAFISYFFDYDGSDNDINDKLGLIKDYEWSPAEITENCVRFKDNMNVCIDSFIS